MDGNSDAAAASALWPLRVAECQLFLQGSRWQPGQLAQSVTQSVIRICNGAVRASVNMMKSSGVVCFYRLVTLSMTDNCTWPLTCV